jgi:hypothetical protein
VRLDEVVGDIDVENGGGIDGAIPEVGVTHHVAGEALPGFEFLKALVHDASYDGPIFNMDDRFVWLVHGCVT